MGRPRNPNLFVTLVFVVIIALPGTIQLTREAAHGERPRVFDLFSVKPTALNLHAYEKNLEDASWVAAQLRPWMQSAHFVLFRDAGEKALLGHDGWCFYKPGVEYLTRRASPAKLGDNNADPLPAITAFRDRLAERGIHLLLLPMPNKESVYPEKLSARAAPLKGLICPQTRSLLDRARAAGIEVVDLFGLYSDTRGTSPLPAGPAFYLAQDSHWSPAGVELTAETVAERLVQRGWIIAGQTVYTTRPFPVMRLGDVLRMLQVPWIERQTPPEPIFCNQVRQPDGHPYRDDPNAQILILGDSFLRIFEHDEPGAAGFIAHLAGALKQPLTSIVNDGGASTLVRQELYRRPALLARKKVVIWEFVERDIRFGTEGWQIIPLPPIPRDP